MVKDNDRNRPPFNFGDCSRGTFWLGALVLFPILLVLGQCSSGNSGGSGSGGVTAASLSFSEVVVQSRGETQKAGLGTPLTISVEIKNSGGRSAINNRLGFFISVNDTIETTDTKLGNNIIISSVKSGDSKSYSPSSVVNAQTSTGVSYYGACLIEADGTEICTAAEKITVFNGLDISLSDFTTQSLAFTAESTSFGISDSFQVTANIDNNGNATLAAATPNATVSFYRSTDGIIDGLDETRDGDDVLLGTLDNSGEILAGGEIATVLSGNVPDEVGTYYYGACVEVAAGVSDEDSDNNCTEGKKVIIIDGVDIEAVNFTVTPEAIIKGGDFTTLSLQARNNGNVQLTADEGDNLIVTFYRSPDEEITKYDMKLDEISSLEAITAKTLSTSILAATDSITATDEGDYYYGACISVIPANIDANTENNCIGTEVAVVDKVELQLRELRPNADNSVDASLFNASGTINLTTEIVPLNFSVRIVNVGSKDLAEVSLGHNLRVIFYRSEDNIISAADTSISVESFSDALASQEITVPIKPLNIAASVSVPASGTYYFGVCVVALPLVEEKDYDTTNNCTAADKVITVAY